MLTEIQGKQLRKAYNEMDEENLYGFGGFVKK